jgi:hypothetical protein
MEITQRTLDLMERPGSAGRCSPRSIPNPNETNLEAG